MALYRSTGKCQIINYETQAGPGYLIEFNKIDVKEGDDVSSNYAKQKLMYCKSNRVSSYKVVNCSTF